MIAHRVTLGSLGVHLPLRVPLRECFGQYIGSGLLTSGPDADGLSSGAL